MNLPKRQQKQKIRLTKTENILFHEVNVEKKKSLAALLNKQNYFFMNINKMNIFAS